MSRKKAYRFRVNGAAGVLVAAFFFLAIAQFAIGSDDREAGPDGTRSASLTGEAHAIDGDTLRISGTSKVRLLGVAAPEKHEAGGPEATDFMKRLVNGRSVVCELTGERSYDRLIGTCFLDGSDIGQALIEAGLARDCPRYSGGRYADVETPAARLLPLPGYCRPR